MKVGDYVRTRWGCVAKFEGINEGFYEFDNIIMDESSAVREKLFVDIVEKSSPNIIDLIELGDYVNGSKVVRIEEHNEELYVYIQETEYCNACDEEENIYYKEDTIKSIVTKEQFESMEYKVGGK